ncbi:MAG: SDR family oxidoreductase [Deltaproteobacteria bacterium]|nr:SDR family oxidoreductase [Deltaproteobacteria bacterium]
MGRVFLTGVTGFVGRYVAARLLARPDVEGLDVLVRARDEAHARERLLDSMTHAVSPDDAPELVARMTPIIGDLRRDRFGLDEEAWHALAGRTTHVLHGAANVRFDQDLEDARSYNVFGTEQAALLAREAKGRGGLDRFDWVGTAFVAGLRRDRVLESELEHAAGWKNPYEQSKYEAEQWLRAHAADLPLTVFRPSIVVGDSSTGATTNFGMLYWPIRLYAKGWWRTVVGSAETPVDIVPVDFVADAIDALSQPGQPVGATYHLTSGVEGAVTIGALAQLAQDFFGGRPARFADPDFFMTWVRPVVDLFIWGPKRRVLRQGGRFFIPYMSGNPLFDNTETTAALAAHGVEVPQVREYFSNLLAYAKSTDFGKKPAETPPA